MPTLVRLLTMLALVAGTIFGIMAALVYLVEPRRHPIVVEVPLDALRQARPPEAAPVAAPGPGGLRP